MTGKSCNSFVLLHAVMDVYDSLKPQSSGDLASGRTRRVCSLQPAYRPLAASMRRALDVSGRSSGSSPHPGYMRVFRS
jgi:hypothetical protein